MESIQIHHLDIDKGDSFECPYCKKQIVATIDSEKDTIFFESVSKHLEK